MWRTLRYDSIETFKRSWPCHGLPDNLHSISCEFATNGDLLDIECYDDAGKWMDSGTFDGSALLALMGDCQKFGDESD
jgi:hypothetical protein